MSGTRLCNNVSLRVDVSYAARGFSGLAEEDGPKRGQIPISPIVVAGYLGHGGFAGGPRASGSTLKCRAVRVEEYDAAVVGAHKGAMENPQAHESGGRLAGPGERASGRHDYPTTQVIIMRLASPIPIIKPDMAAV